MVVNNRTHRQTFMKMVGVQAGLGFGIAKTRLVFVFETVSAMQSFMFPLAFRRSERIVGGYRPRRNHDPGTENVRRRPADPRSERFGEA